MSTRILHGDCMDILPTLAEASVDSVVTDPPYEIAFMGRKWDNTGVAFSVETWRAVYRVMKPGAHLLAFGGTRTSHRMVCAIEDAGFEIRDSVYWLYGSGFPKSLDVGKAIDKVAGAVREVIGDGPYAARRPRADHATQGNTFADDGYVRPAGHAVTAPATPEAAQWAGWGTALKPACEPIVLARKPLIGTVAANVLAHGTGGINVDACRVETDPTVDDPRLGGKGAWTTTKAQDGDTVSLPRGTVASSPLGRWPANCVHDGSDEVMAAFAAYGEKGGGLSATSTRGVSRSATEAYKIGDNRRPTIGSAVGFGDTGTAARFFYSAKATAEDRMGSKHPTIKPLALMDWLVRLITPPGGVVLDPFAGSGTTLLAADRLQMNAIGIDMEAQHVEDIRRRFAIDAPLFAEVAQ